MAEGKLYFAYGSNINLDQMAQRCPDAQVVGPVTLENYELLFRGNLRGAGVATIAPREGSTVHGLLWNITPECERSLDYYEGYPHLYGKEPVTVHGHDGQNGLPTQPLKQAWEHCVEEVPRETERINRSACGQLSPRRKKDRGR